MTDTVIAMCGLCGLPLEMCVCAETPAPECPAEALANQLIGSCQMCIVEEALDTPELVEKFQSLAFECDNCGWWCDVEELNNLTEQELCDDCNNEINGEDEDDGD